ncbi:cupin domain-containing protein [Leeuwenhoekiella marinoflava]|uniref:cupin domain-containing protein n=1 Tax=Leeuwenhoekiella marinoflava TaxID=988 RepID=UPI00300165D6
MMNSIESLISELNLKPHPEGGYFKETYRSEEEIPQGILSNKFTGNRNYSTCIYFLLESDNFSAFHKVNQDEIWHFYDGSPIRLHIISELGIYSNQLIGIDIQNGQTPQFVVKGGSWFAAEFEAPSSYSFVGCTVSPGFSFDDFELASRDRLLNMFPENNKLIKRLTRG